MEHISVLTKEVDQYLDLSEGDVVVDATLGLGGHSKNILEKILKNGKLIAFDQDSTNLEEAKRRLKEFEKQTVYIKDNFRNLKTRVIENGFASVDAILFDLGLCSTHVDTDSRGFSFIREGALDMRFDTDSGKTAADIVNNYDVEELSRIFREYGEEKSAYRIAKEICSRREEKLFETTTELSEFIKSVYPKIKIKNHPATKIFQAIRIEVNEEMSVLSEALKGAFEILKPGGRIVIISYHSLEDRIVKKFFKALEQPLAAPEEQIFRTFADPFVKNLTKKPITPGDTELAINPRSRSAKLRAYIKLK